MSQLQRKGLWMVQIQGECSRIQYQLLITNLVTERAHFCGHPLIFRTVCLVLHTGHRIFLFSLNRASTLARLNVCPQAGSTKGCKTSNFVEARRKQQCAGIAAGSTSGSTQLPTHQASKEGKATQEQHKQGDSFAVHSCGNTW